MAIGAGVLVAVSLLVFGALAAARWRASSVQDQAPAVTQASPDPSAAGVAVPQEVPATTQAPPASVEPAPLSSKAFADAAALPTAVTPSGPPVSPAVVPERAGRAEVVRPPADAAGRALSAAQAKFEGGQLDAALADTQAFLKDYPGHPRTIEANDGARIERGLVQRLTALNRFIDDLYHERRIIAAGVVPEDIVATSANFLPACVGANPPFDHPHIFCDMGDDGEIICEYCSTLYRYDPKLGAEQSRPADCIWTDSQAA